jgi:hypothetical protein
MVRQACRTCYSALRGGCVRSGSGRPDTYAPFGISLYGFPVILEPRTAVICFPWKSLKSGYSDCHLRPMTMVLTDR